MHSFYDEDVLNIISWMFNNSGVRPKNILKCELCGTDFDEIKATGRVGCSNCYKVFEKQFASTLLRLHGKTLHVGKIPNKIIENGIKKEQDDEQTELENLKNKLAEAVLREEYEKAAIIRDEIRKREA
jgi:protein arginine kinase activator